MTDSDSLTATASGATGAPSNCVRHLKSIGILVPVFNEANSIQPFYEAMAPVLESVGCRSEILFVDDGSIDGTRAAIKELMADHPDVRLVGLSRNFGKEAALTAGIDRLETDVVIPIDVDLQDPPELIPTLVERWRQGFDVVNAVRSDRSADSWLKRATARLFYGLINAMSHTDIPADAGDFRLVDRRVVAALRRLPERNRLMKGIFAWVGFRSVAVGYKREARHAGSTSLRWRSLWRLALDGITGFTTLPLRVWTYVGVSIALISFAYGAFIIAQTMIYGMDVPGYASLMVAVLFLGGVQLMSLGIMGEYLGRLFVEAKQRPIYLVDEES